MYQYEFPHPAVTTDVVAFSVFDGDLRVLLIRRNEAPFKSDFALPGGFVRIDEDIQNAAHRVLNEKTPLEKIYIEQLYTFGNPERDPRERVISVVYMAIVPFYQILDIKELWQNVNHLPELAFDHNSIIMLAQQRLRSKLRYSTIAFGFLPQTFTLTEIQKTYEVVLGESLEKRNFRKQIMARNILKSTGEYSQGGAHRPALLYKLLDDDTLQYW